MVEAESMLVAVAAEVVEDQGAVAVAYGQAT